MKLQLGRKKISERMKLLQDLVPGCSKVTSPLFGVNNFPKTRVIHTLQIPFK
jgi:hypothetical protein